MADAKNPDTRRSQTPLRSQRPLPSQRALGLHVVLRWGGDVQVSRFFPRPIAITVGEDATFTLPADVLGGEKSILLVEPHDEAGFALRLDSAALTGTLNAPGEVVSLDQLRSAGRALQTTRVPLSEHVRADLQLGDFSLELSRTPQPAALPATWWSREQTGLLACTLLALLAVGAPLLHGLASPDWRRQTRVRHAEQLDNPFADYLEVALIDQVESQSDREPPDSPGLPGPDGIPDLDPARKRLPIAPPDQDPPKGPIATPPRTPPADPDSPPRKPPGREQITGLVDRTVDTIGLPDGTDPGKPAGPNWGQGASTVPASPRPGGDDPAFQRPTGGSAPGIPPEPMPTHTLPPKIATGPAPTITLPTKKPDGPTVIRRDPASIEGGLGKDIVRQYMDSRHGAIKSCYQKNLQSNPDLTGDLVAHFLIQPNGTVVGVKLESTLHDTGMESCIRNNIASWHFPIATNGAATEVRKRWSFVTR